MAALPSLSKQVIEACDEAMKHQLPAIERIKRAKFSAIGKSDIELVSAIAVGLLLAVKCVGDPAVHEQASRPVLAVCIFTNQHWAQIQTLCWCNRGVCVGCPDCQWCT